MSTSLYDSRRVWFTRPGKPDDAARIAELWQDRFDPWEDIPAEDMEAWLPGSDVYEYNHAWVADTPTQGVVAAGLASLGTPEYLQDALHLSDAELEELTDGWLGYFVINVVDEGWTNQGIGTELFRKRFEWFVEEDVDQAFGVSWDRESGPTSQPIFDRFGFEAVATKPDLYWEDERTCPDCGGRCECPAVIYRRNLR